ncbi:MAG: iron ABC transporter permease [Chloroflexota bacterium]|nr:iron ABC transporter permease [Chloroflexota bacterium]
MANRPLAQLRERRPDLAGAAESTLPRLLEPVAWGILTAGLIALVLVNLALGAFDVELPRIIGVLFGKVGIDLGIDYTTREEAVVWVIRVPRMLMAAAVGAGLGISGAALQGLFRNPLADPGLIGVSSGAAFAIAVSVVVGISAWGLFALPLAAFIGGLTLTFLIYGFARRGGRAQMATMLLVGIAVNALLGAAISFIISFSDDEELRDIVFWLLGSLAGSLWEYVYSAGPLILFAILVLVRQAGALNLLSLGDAEARHLGVPVQRTQLLIVAAAAMATGAGVAVAGVVGFIGLIAPHIVRLAVGPDHRRLMPASAMAGAILVLGADLAARTIAEPAELPLGVLTAMIGTPVFLFLIDRSRRSLASGF